MMFKKPYFLLLIVALLIANPVFSLSCSYPNTVEQGGNLVYECSLGLENVTGCCLLVNDGEKHVELFPSNCAANDILNSNVIAPKGDKLLVQKAVEWTMREGVYSFKTFCWNDVNSEQYTNNITVTYYYSQPNFVMGWIKSITDNMVFVFIGLVFLATTSYLIKKFL